MRRSQTTPCSYSLFRLLPAGRSNNEDIFYRKPPSPTSHQRQKLPFPATDGHDLTNGATHAGIAFERLAPNRRLDSAYIR